MLEMATVSCGWQVFNEKKSIARLKLIPPAMPIKIAIPPVHQLPSVVTMPKVNRPAGRLGLVGYHSGMQ